jgi:hypothetical protein
MENASKALIIAGAILISILIISFGVIILGQGSDVINNANMSEAEIAAFNKKFEAYEGTNVRGSNVKQLMKTVAAHNRSQADSDKKVQVVKYDKGSNPTAKNATPGDDTIIATSGNEGTYAPSISSGEFYKVKCIYASTGLIEEVAVILTK